MIATSEDASVQPTGFKYNPIMTLIAVASTNQPIGSFNQYTNRFAQGQKSVVITDANRLCDPGAAWTIAMDAYLKHEQTGINNTQALGLRWSPDREPAQEDGFGQHAGNTSGLKVRDSWLPHERDAVRDQPLTQSKNALANEATV